MTVTQEDAKRVICEVIEENRKLGVGGTPEELNELFKKWCRDNDMDESVMPTVVNGLCSAFHSNLLSHAMKQTGVFDQEVVGIEGDSPIMEACLFYLGCGAFRMGYEMAKQFGSGTDLSGWDT